MKLVGFLSLAAGIGANKDIDPQFDIKGLIPVDEKAGAALWYGYWEKGSAGVSSKDTINAQTVSEDEKNETPIYLWLNGGPGCSSAKGSIYELGPKLVSSDGSTLLHNPFGYNSAAGLLVVDQPYGTGFSPAGTAPLHTSVYQTTRDLYRVLNTFFKQNPTLAKRPFILTGESYAGKYIPSLLHYVFQVTHPNQAKYLLPGQTSFVQPGEEEQPLFDLRGAQIGNGFIEPAMQMEQMVTNMLSVGVIPDGLKAKTQRWNRKGWKAMMEGKWGAAVAYRERIIDVAETSFNLATLFNPSRLKKYDNTASATKYFNSSNQVRELWGAKPVEEHKFVACSPGLASSMGNDVMRPQHNHLVEAAKGLNVPIHLFNGALDVKDGTSTHWAWMRHWFEDKDFDGLLSARQVVFQTKDGSGYFAVSKNGLWSFTSVHQAGHMVPVETPHAANHLINRWVQMVLSQEGTPAGLKCPKAGEALAEGEEAYDALKQPWGCVDNITPKKLNKGDPMYPLLGEDEVSSEEDDLFADLDGHRCSGASKRESSFERI